MDESLNMVQSDEEIVKLGLRIKDQVRSVYGPALAAAITAVGATGGLWGIMNAAAENSPRILRENEWHYVWVLAKKSGTRVA